jgi:tetratricopeptide (TPR) repeat protein
MSTAISKTPCWVVAMVALVLARFLFPVCAVAQYEPAIEGALAEFRAGNYASAAAKFAAVEAATPGTTDALLFQAKCFVHLEDFVGAETALHKYLGAHRKSADAMYLLGFVQHRENRPVESLETYTQAAALVRPTGDDLKIVGLDYVLLNDYPDAIKWLEKSVELDPENKDAWYYLGRAYYTRSRLIDARKAFIAVLNLDPVNAKAENSLGLIFESDAQPAAAIDAYRKSISWSEQSPHPSEQPYVNLGGLLLEQGRTKEAIPPLEKAVLLAPNSGFCRLKLGTAYLRAGRVKEAQNELEKATQLEPENAIAHYQLGKLYKAIHAKDSAQAEFDRAAELQTRAAGSQSSPPNH